MSFNYRRIIIKIGSNVITRADGLPDVERIAHLVNQIAEIKKQGIEVILVSSGAVASGRSLISVSEKSDAVAVRQLLASIGQVKLINTYSHLFEKFSILCSQVLVTKEDFRDRLHYLNMRNCLEILLQHQVIPVINENDVVSVTELMFTDNDELAGLIASMLNAQALLVLTNVDGIYTGDPKLESSSVIQEVNDAGIDFASFVSSGRSQFGRGGMITKSTIAHKVAKLGIAVHIANGTKENILTDVLANKVIHTRFTPTKKASGKKKWLAHSENAATGVVQVNEGAKTVLISSKASSLLPVGIINIVSDFKKGEIIKIVDEHNKTIGLGLAEYGSDKARELTGKKTRKHWYITITFICRDNMDYKHYFENALIAGRNAALSPAVINKVLLDVAKAAIEQTDYLLQENKKDLERMAPTDPKYDRLTLTADRIKAIAGDIENVAGLDSPLGKVLSEKTLPNGLYIKKVRMPLGVVGIVYEARPNVTFDVFALCFKTGNISILKGGSDADNSNRAIMKVIHGVLSAHSIDPNFATLLPVEREATEALLNAVGFVDVLIPRGSQSLINYVRSSSKVPVIETGAGIVHTYFDETGDLEKAIAIIDNAKTRRVSVCNALDCLIINSKRLGDLIHITEPLGVKGVKIYADKKAYEVLDSLYPAELLEHAQPEHFGTEFLSMTMSIKTVDTLEQALEHIAINSSKHSEAILSEDELNIETFLNRVDAAAVYVNTSTAFTDGAQFGLGAEIGISTQKLHARGPMGLEELTSYKWIVKGNGQIRTP